MFKKDITHWFGNQIKTEKKNSKIKIPNYFYLNSESEIAKWLTKIPISAIKIGSIDWRLESSIKRVTLCCSIKFYEQFTTDKDFSLNRINYNFNSSHLQILMSQLQKSIRRKDKEIALKTAVSMCLIEEPEKKIKQKGLFELLRRFTIIIIEDAILNSYYTNLVWYLGIISKGYRLSNKSVINILKIIKLTIDSIWKDKSYRHVKLVENRDYSKLINSIEYSQKKYMDLLWSLYFRTSYKGMYCDTNMIYRTIILWKERIVSDSIFIKFLDANLYKIKNDVKLEGLNIDEILKESIDFHCTDICNRISIFTDIESSKIKELIWNYRSSINNRIDIEPIKNKDLLKKSRDENLWISLNNIVDIESSKIISEKF